MPPHPSNQSPRPTTSRRYVLAATILASAMAFIDGSIVTIALPTIGEQLPASFNELQWVMNAYALFLGGLILVGGSAGDRFGRKRIFIIGIVIFAIASLLCAIAPSVLALILARGLKGIGAALLIPQSLAIIAANFPQDIRGRAIGLWAGAAALTTTLGPPLGGLLIDALSWRSIFWINIPLSLLTIALTLTHIPESKEPTNQGPLDWLGALTAVTGCGLLTIGLTLFVEAEQNFSGMLLMLLGLMLLIALIPIEKKVQNPLIPLSLFRNHQFTTANILTLFLYGALTAILFLLPFELIERRNFSSAQAGFTLLPLGILIGLLSRHAGKLADGYGPSLLMTVGSSLVTASACLLAITVNDFWVGIMMPLLLLALGMAMVVTPLTTAVMNSAPDHLSGAASGINNAASRLAGLFAVAIVSLIVSASQDFITGYQISMVTAACWAAIATVAALLFSSPRQAPG